MVNFVDFEKLIHVKLYSLLILTKNTLKSKNNFETPKKTKIGLFPSRNKQKKSAVYRQWDQRLLYGT